MKKCSLIAGLLLACSLAHAQGQASGVGVISGVGQWSAGLGVVVTGKENLYCPKGSSPEMTEGIPTWGATDDLATLPSRCMYTGLDATPSPGNIYTPASTATLSNVILSAGSGAAVNSDGTTTGSPTMHMGCGDSIILTAGTTYVGEYHFPALSCDGLHWITVKTSGATNANFPGEGVRATPCITGLANDAVHNGGVRQVSGYPDYTCPSYPTVLTAKIQQGHGTTDAAFSFEVGANHYRFIGIELVKDPAHNADALVQLAPDNSTLGANHIIWDRSIIHGVPWTPASVPADEMGNGFGGKNSQWVAIINGWIYDTYCNSSCVDSHDFSAGTGIFQDGPFKIYNMFGATAGETWFFGGGGLGPGTPTPKDVEIRSTHSFKPLTWMVPINTCLNYYQAITKNLSEFKNMSLAIIEGNVFENSFQGCQSDQSGYAFLFNPGSQNNHLNVRVNYNGTSVVNLAPQCVAGSNADNACSVDSDCPSSVCRVRSFTHDTKAASSSAGNPIDPLNCPPLGCVLEDVSNSNFVYRICNSANGCDQSGIPNQQCAAGVNAGNSCTTDAQCPSSFCAPTTTARLTQPAPTQSGVTANACVPGDCPSCKNKDITFRFNEIYNVTNGIQINTGLSSHCHDQASGMSNISIHDNEMHGLSREMSNGVDPYSGSTGFVISNNSIPPSVLQSIGIRHNTIAVETGNPAGVSGFGNQVERSDLQYLKGLAITDNVSPASWGVSVGTGSNATKGIGGLAGLANTYALNSCQRYFTAEVPDGTVPGPPYVPVQSYSFAGLPSGGTNYMVTRNGLWTAITAQLAMSFTVTATVKAGDTIVVRDLNDCDFTFASNVMGSGVAIGFNGFGQDQSPYPNLISGASSSYQCGGSGLLSCLLPGSSFVNLFNNWDGGRNGNYTIVSPNFVGTASDRLSRPATGQSPGTDQTLFAAKTAGVRTATNLPALAITSAGLPAATHGIAYSTQLQASFGASQFWAGYKGWFLETDPANCGGSCGTLGSSGLVIARNGAVNGPLPILSVSRTGCPAACLSTYTESMTIVAGSLSVGQVASMSQFLDKGTCDAAHPTNCDSSFNGPCTITAVGNNTFSCAMTNGVNFNIPGHNPNSPKTCGVVNNNFCDSIVSFAPVTVGSYTFWVGARDGAFQVARKQISVTVN